MTLTTEVRINYPVPAKALLDHVTRVAGGDPDTIVRGSEPGSMSNRAGQGLKTLAWVNWSEEPDEGDPEWPCPPALVVLSIDNPYGFGGETGRAVQANEILPRVVEWLDDRGVPRESWWWEDETAGTYHPGSVDVALLNADGDRETWGVPTPVS